MKVQSEKLDELARITHELRELRKAIEMVRRGDRKGADAVLRTLQAARQDEQKRH